MELVQVGEKTYYIKNPTNIGIYKENEKDIWLIDSGNDKDAGKKILKIVEENHWNVKGIMNTHSHADHIGGNQVIQNRTNCQILCHGIENYFIQSPILEPSFLYGGYPMDELQNNKFLMAKESNVEKIEDHLLKELEYISLKGHSFDMIGIKTPDDIYFLGDGLISEETIQKYHIFFLYDVQEYLNTLDMLQNLNGKLYIPSHCEATNDISYLIQINRDKIHEIANTILSICSETQTFDSLLKALFDHYDLILNINQYVLVGNTVKSYLAWLKNNHQIDIFIQDNTLFWKISH